jgi:hypothetical protein
MVFEVPQVDEVDNILARVGENSSTDHHEKIKSEHQ